MFKSDMKYKIVDIVFLVILFTFGRYYIFIEFLSKKSYFGLVIVFIGVYSIRFFFRPSYEYVRKVNEKGWKITGYYSKKSLIDKKIYINSYDFWVKINLIMLTLYILICAIIIDKYTLNNKLMYIHMLIICFIQIESWVITNIRERIKWR